MSRATFLLGTTSVKNCLELLFAATSLTSDRVMSPNGSFSTVVNTQFVLEWGQGGVFGWVGGNSKLCAFLKRGRNLTYLWGLHRRSGRCVFKIWMSRLPERTKKNQHVQFLRQHRNRAVFPSYSRVSQIKVNEGNKNRGDKFKWIKSVFVRAIKLCWSRFWHSLDEFRKIE